MRACHRQRTVTHPSAGQPEGRDGGGAAHRARRC